MCVCVIDGTEKKLFEKWPTIILFSELNNSMMKNSNNERKQKTNNLDFTILIDCLKGIKYELIKVINESWYAVPNHVNIEWGSTLHRGEYQGNGW